MWPGDVSFSFSLWGGGKTINSQVHGQRQMQQTRTNFGESDNSGPMKLTICSQYFEQFPK